MIDAVPNQQEAWMPLTVVLRARRVESRAIHHTCDEVGLIG